MNIDGKRWFVWGAISIATAGLLAWALWPAPERVDFAPVTRGPLLVTLDEDGETRVRERFVISAPVAGRLLRIELEPGDVVVAEKTVLATFLPRDATPLDLRGRAEAEENVRALEADLERAKHERDRARAEVEFAAKDCARDRELLALEVLSKANLDITELREKQANETLDAAEHAVEAATHLLESGRARLLNLGSPGRQGDEPIMLRAPTGGVVLRRLRESESVVSAGEPLLEVGNPSDLEIVADYLSRDAVRIAPGARVLIERWGGEQALVGEVRRIDPSGFTKISALGVEEQRVNVVIDLQTSRADRPSLADGFRVETRIVVAECDGVVQAPTGSLFRRGEGWAVFVIENDRARIRAVAIGLRTPTSVEILEGLSPADTVIDHPGEKISDGVRVVSRED